MKLGVTEAACAYVDAFRSEIAGDVDAWTARVQVASDAILGAVDALRGSPSSREPATKRPGVLVPMNWWHVVGEEERAALTHSQHCYDVYDVPVPLDPGTMYCDHECPVAVAYLASAAAKTPAQDAQPNTSEETCSFCGKSCADLTRHLAHDCTRLPL